MTKKKTKSQMLVESLEEAINPKPKSDLHEATQNLLSNYRDVLPSADSEDERPQKTDIAVHISEDLPSTVVSFERPQKLEPPSTEKIVDVLPSAPENLPSTDPDQTGDSAVKPSAPKIVDGKKIKKTPSTSDRHNNNSIGRFDNRISKSVIRQIKEFCLKNDINQKDFVEMSAVHFMETWTAKFAKIVDGKTSHDDGLKMMIYKTAPRIINLYRAYNPENKWKFRDDQVGSSYNHTDIRLIELGFIQTQFNASFKKINSFEYYKNEIESYIGQQLAGEMLDFLLNHYRGKWKESSGREIDFSFLEEKTG